MTTERLVSLTVVVEDPRGDAAQLAIYRYPQVLDCSLSAADFLFPIGSIIAVREPYYRLPVHGHFPTIRVDSPSDLIFLDPQTNFVKNVTWTSGIIRRPAYFLQTAEEWKNMGNQHFQRKDWLCAAVAFSEGLKLSPNHDLLLLNRAAAYLELGWFNSAAFDADSFLTRYATHPTVHKAVFRAAKAYYMAERYEACANLVSRFGKGRFPQAEDYATRALQRIRERDHGEYNWDSIFDDCLRQRPIARPDIASFQGPVEIKTPSSAGQPRGLFVTEDVKAGALLVCFLCRRFSNDQPCNGTNIKPIQQVVSRPIVSYYPEEAPIKEYFASINLIKNSMDRRSDYILVDLLVQRMWDDLELTRRVGKMYAGDDFPPIWDDSPSTSSARPLPSHPRVPLTDIDIARAEAVCSMDGFTIDDMMSHTKRESRKTDDYPCALYELPSYCNHACLPSGSRVFFGDVMVIRAARDLKAGDEVTLMYYGLDARSSQDRQAEIQQKWGFTCTCLLCKADLVDPPEARRTRARLSTPSLMPDADIAKANAITVKSTYVDSPERRATGNFKPELHTSLKLLALANQRQLPHPELIITIIMDGLESIGLVITNREFGNGAPAGKFKIHPKQLVDVTRPPPLTHLCVPIIHEMVTAMYLIKQTQRARAWETVAVWCESCISKVHSLQLTIACVSL